MSIFDILTLFGGLAMFLYGMRLMGDGLKESSSGALKRLMEQVTNNPVKAFLLGLTVTAVIQSSTATIVITSGLVAAGILTLHQSLGIVIGANVGTTVTGQIIRLLDLNTSAAGWLRIFQPSSLAPIALIIGIVMIMGFKFKNARTIGNIAIGFGILFSGLLNMTSAVDALSSTGIFERLFSSLGSNPLIGYATGATVAFILQSSSATIGILQALSSSGMLTFNAVYAVIVGVYLGDCVTTAIVCSIGARAEQKRVGILNILYNLSKSVLTIAGVLILKNLGVLDGIWFEPVNPGRIANANTIFNLACALILLPVVGMFEKAAKKIVKDDPSPLGRYAEKLEALSPAFFSTPALALRSCYDVLTEMLIVARENINRAFDLLHNYDASMVQMVSEDEDNLDLMADHVSRYLAELASVVTTDLPAQILNQYYKDVNEFERLGDYAQNIADAAEEFHQKNVTLSDEALAELDILRDLLNEVLDNAELAFRRRNLHAAYKIEPLEQVVDDMTETLHSHHLVRLSKGKCTAVAGAGFMEILHSIERISDTCSNVGLATIARVYPEIEARIHEYTYELHSGKNADFNRRFNDAHARYFNRLNEVMPPVED